MDALPPPPENTEMVLCGGSKSSKMRRSTSTMGLKMEMRTDVIEKDHHELNLLMKKETGRQGSVVRIKA